MTHHRYKNAAVPVAQPFLAVLLGYSASSLRNLSALSVSALSFFSARHFPGGF
jgi:hypothetical protein